MENFNINGLLSQLIQKADNEQKKRVVAVIPVFNEERHIGEVINQTKKYATIVIVIDDASTDNTYKIAKQAGAIVFKHAINLQKGAALKTGCEAAIMFKADIIITLDGDGQHDPNEIPEFLRELKNCEIVIGTRDFNKDMPLNSKIGNIILSKLSKWLLKNEILDSQTGFRAFKSSIYPKIRWESNDYSVEIEMIKNIRKYGILYKEIKIKTIYNDKYKGTTFVDGVKITMNMIKWRIKK